MTTLFNQIDGKVLAQVLSGGVAGATLTFILNQIVARRKLAQITVSTSRTDYSIPAHDTDLRAVEVSYGGKTFEKLLLYELTVRNISARTTKSAPFLILLSRDTEIVDRSCTIYPVNRADVWQKQDADKATVYLWEPGELKRDDYAILRVLLTPAANVDWRFRGDDDIRVVSEDAETVADLQRDTRLITAWLAFYYVVGVVPFAAPLLRGLLILLTTPFLVNRVPQWRALLTHRRFQGGVVDVTMKDVSVQGDVLIENRGIKQR